MSSILSLILLQINLFGGGGEPLTGTKVYAEDANSGEVVAYTKIGQSGKFKFSNLDPGNYVISLDVPANSVKQLDKRSRDKFDTDIEVAYNYSKEIYCWQRDDGFVTMEIVEKSKLAEAVIPKFSTKEEKQDQNIEEDPDIKSSKTTNERVCILQFTVIGKYGTLGGLLTSIGQKEFHKLTIGTKDISLEDAGEVKIIKRTGE